MRTISTLNCEHAATYDANINATAIAAMQAWCVENYNSGADTMVECWSIDDYAQLIARCDGDIALAWADLKSVADVYAERQADSQYYRDNA